MADALRLGIVGLGMGAGRVIPEIARLPFIKLTAGADIRPHSVKQFREEFGAEAYQSVEEMCQSPNVDAVYVCTPHEFHCEHTIIALKNKKHVIVEKPSENENGRTAQLMALWGDPRGRVVPQR